MSALEAAQGVERGEQLWEIILSTGSVAKIENDRDQECGLSGRREKLSKQSL